MTTTPTPDADVRAALERASRTPGLGFDPEAVLARGHRAVRRRRIAVTGFGVAATAVVAAVAIQVGTSQSRPLPALPPTSSHTTVPSATGSFTGTTFGDAPKDGPGFEVTVTPASGDTVREAWTFYDGETALGTVNRTRPALQPGQASFLMPRESGREGVVYAYVVTGYGAGVVTVEHVETGVSRGTGDGIGAPLRQSGTQRIVGAIVMQTLGGDATEDDVIGLTWIRTDVVGTSMRSLAAGAAVRTDRPGDSRPSAVVVEAGPRTSLLVWRDGDRFGAGGRWAPTAPDSGPLQVTAQPRGTALLGAEPDLAVGWVASTPVTLTSTDPSDSFTVAYGDPVGGRTPFVALSGNPDVKGTVTVTGAGETQVLTHWDITSP